MKTFQRVSAWWRTSPLVPDHDIVAVPQPHMRPRVPQDYLSLYTYLEHRYASTVVLTFQQMEALLGFALPATAETEPGWWTGAPTARDVHANAWCVAGRTATPNLSARTVAFERAV